MKHFLTILLLLSFQLAAQIPSDLRIEPPFWWTGFRNSQLQVMIHAKNIGTCHCSLRGSQTGNFRLMRQEGVENPNYLFVTFDLSRANPCKFEMVFSREGKEITKVMYELKARQPGSELRKGFTTEDVIYLLMPDRFANGDLSNDNPSWALEKTKRSNPDGRHGGDIKGIMDHLDYLQDLGVTAIWINPLLENQQPKYSYHGYSTTDYYRIDPRFGSNEDYRKLADALHQRGMKLIMDQIINHCGSGHWWIQDLPMKDWLNQWPEFTRSTYRAGTVNDPYASACDSVKFVKGWFDGTMPDLNQHNRFLRTYLIQNSIWWIEFAGLDGIRQDTHPYPFKDMMSQWGKCILGEYPYFNVVGECWMNYPASVAYWQEGAHNNDGYNSHLPSVFDFPLYDALGKAFNEPESWTTGILRLYEILAQDMVYPNPSNIVFFADNHDVNRYLDTQQDDVRKLKMAMAFILTSRGIPQIFYGTEILMTTGADKGHGSIRKDFPGGWPGDPANAFISTGRTPQQNDMFQYLQKLLQWRKNNPIIQHGHLRHFIPENGIYAYFRYHNRDAVMIVLNNNETDKTIETGRFREFLKDKTSGTEIIT